MNDEEQQQGTKRFTRRVLHNILNAAAPDQRTKQGGCPEVLGCGRSCQSWGSLVAHARVEYLAGLCLFSH